MRRRLGISRSQALLITEKKIYHPVCARGSEEKPFFFFLPHHKTTNEAITLGFSLSDDDPGFSLKGAESRETATKGNDLYFVAQSEKLENGNTPPLIVKEYDTIMMVCVDTLNRIGTITPRGVYEKGTIYFRSQNRGRPRTKMCDLYSGVKIPTDTIVRRGAIIRLLLVRRIPNHRVMIASHLDLDSFKDCREKYTRRCSHV